MLLLKVMNEAHIGVILPPKVHSSDIRFSHAYLPACAFTCIVAKIRAGLGS